MTAVTTSPFLTPALGCACLTDALIKSPTSAYFLREPPRMRMHMISLAPVLSATLRRDCGWIMACQGSTVRRGGLATPHPLGALFLLLLERGLDLGHRR